MVIHLSCVMVEAKAKKRMKEPLNDVVVVKVEFFLYV